jgi:L-serine dehydratase
MDQYPSIFNDVIGPVMRGPSSSHCAAALRIGRLSRDLMNGTLTHILISFDPNGSLATTHASQGSDMGLWGGFLGWEADDERLPEAKRYLDMAGIDMQIEITPVAVAHPNVYALLLTGEQEVHRLTAISTGGGMIEVLNIDGAAVSMSGDYNETLVYCTFPLEVKQYLERHFPNDEILIHQGDITFVELKSPVFPEASILAELRNMKGVLSVRNLAAVLPVLSRKDLTVPFITVEEMLRYHEADPMKLWQLALRYESVRGNISEESVWNMMVRIVRIMESSIQSGLNGTYYEDRLLGSQSVNFKKQLERGNLVKGTVINRMIMYVSAIMEVKSSMGVIVAAPTAGSCGALPGAVLGMADALDLPQAEKVRAMLAAGIIGVFIAAHATFAAEVGGCQAECGSGACMAAAAMVYLAGGSLSQSLSAASLALQNSLGMICDPIANRVEAPCLGKNVLAATNAFSCANMALSDYDHLIPLDEVITAMDAVGHSIPHTLRCTNLGGLSITKTARELEARLNASPQFFKSC